MHLMLNSLIILRGYNDGGQFFLNHPLTRNVFNIFTWKHFKGCNRNLLPLNSNNCVKINLPAATFMCVLDQTDDEWFDSAGVWGKAGEECVWYLDMSE